MERTKDRKMKVEEKSGDKTKRPDISRRGEEKTGQEDKMMRSRKERKDNKIKKRPDIGGEKKR